MVVLSAPTKQRFEDMLSEYFYSKNISVDYENLTLSNLNGLMINFKIKVKKSRFQLLSK